MNTATEDDLTVQSTPTIFSNQTFVDLCRNFDARKSFLCQNLEMIIINGLLVKYSYDNIINNFFFQNVGVTTIIMKMTRSLRNLSEN